MNRWVLAVIAVVTALAGGVLMYLNWPRPPELEPSRAEQIASMDQLMDSLAKRAKAALKADDFTVLVTQSEEPVGALLRLNSTVVKNDTDCVADPQPRTANVPNFAPRFKMSRDLAATIGLPDIFPAVSGVEASAVRTDELEMSFAQPGRQLLSDDALANILARPACRAALASEPLWIVRGYVSGKRTFLLKNIRNNQAVVQGELVPNFMIKPVGASEVAVIDEKPTLFLQLVSEVRAPASADAPPQIRPLETDIIGGAVQRQGRIYVQRDETDLTNKPQEAVEGLKAAGYRVASSVEDIATTKMPKVPQVRYFNTRDEAQASAVAKTLRMTYPLTQTLLVGIPAPSGQLEVWLPRGQP